MRRKREENHVVRSRRNTIKGLDNWTKQTMENIAMEWGDFLTCDDETLKKGRQDKARIMIWAKNIMQFLIP